MYLRENKFIIENESSQSLENLLRIDGFYLSIYFLFLKSKKHFFLCFLLPFLLITKRDFSFVENLENTENHKEEIKIIFLPRNKGFKILY